MARDVQHSSFFSYNVQRSYPFRWFTPVAIVGGIILIVLISFANFVASGYELTTVYSSDPSAIDNGLWFKNWPEWLRNNINATCEPANLPVGSQFFTNQTALAYTMSSINTTKDGGSTTSPSLPYLDNVLKHCEVLNITMDFSCSQLQNPTQIASSACTIDVRAYSMCTFDGPNGLTTFNCSSLYNPVQSWFSSGSSSLIDINASSRASIWWAQQLLLAYWFDTLLVVFETLNPWDNGNFSDYNADKDILQGAANFYRHEGQEDIAELDFFDLWFEFTALKTTTFYSTNINGQKGNPNHVVATWSLTWGQRHSFTFGRLCLRHLLTLLPITFSGQKLSQGVFTGAGAGWNTRSTNMATGRQAGEIDVQCCHDGSGPDQTSTFEQHCGECRHFTEVFRKISITK